MQRLMQQLSTLISRRIKMKRLKRSLARSITAALRQRGILAPRYDHKHQVNFYFRWTAVRICVCADRRPRADPFSQGSALEHFPYPNGCAGGLPAG